MSISTFRRPGILRRTIAAMKQPRAKKHWEYRSNGTVMMNSANRPQNSITLTASARRNAAGRLSRRSDSDCAQRCERDGAVVFGAEVLITRRMTLRRPWLSIAS
ncbi:hypothetical protein D3C76_1428140 [compost metagenome]